MYQTCWSRRQLTPKGPRQSWRRSPAGWCLVKPISCKRHLVSSPAHCCSRAGLLKRDGYLDPVRGIGSEKFDPGFNHSNVSHKIFMRASGAVSECSEARNSSPRMSGCLRSRPQEECPRAFPRRRLVQPAHSKRRDHRFIDPLTRGFVSPPRPPQQVPLQLHQSSERAVEPGPSTPASRPSPHMQRKGSSLFEPQSCAPRRQRRFLPTLVPMHAPPIRGRPMS
jgi:hypothetical protein